MKRTPFKKSTKTLKRNGFKVKTTKTLKRGLKRKIKGKKGGSRGGIKSISKLKKELWKLCREITIKKYGNTCYTSGQQNLEGINLQCGHGKPKGALPLKFQYDLRNLRPQSYHANINLGGMSDIFIAKLEREKEGLEFLQEACVKIDGRWEIKREPPMTSMEAYNFILQKIKEYKEILKSL